MEINFKEMVSLKGFATRGNNFFLDFTRIWSQIQALAVLMVSEDFI